MNSTDSLRNIRRIWPYLSIKRRYQLLVLLLLLISSSLAELVSLTTVIPFLSLLIDYRNSDEISIINHIPYISDLTRSQVLFFLFGFLYLFTFFLRSSRFFVFRLSAYMSAAIGSDIATLVFYKNVSPELFISFR